MNVFLYIGNRRADLNDQSLILYNYTMEDLSNPTTVRSAYTQQITLPGTPTNDDIFGHIYRSDRQNMAGGNTGVNFNPSIRTPFTIYSTTSAILEAGYIKLDKITRKPGGVREYTITLYGNLGSFLYGLSHRSDGEKMTLADLKYTGASATDDELNFVINWTSIFAAWQSLAGGQPASIWDIINFAPAYNGIPSGEFDADKAIIDTDSYNLHIPSGYKAQAGTYVIANLPKKYTEWEVQDLRSYLQRPVIKFSRIIQAICASYNNGGYTVDLDGTFFNSSNPYYSKTYLTLPILNTLTGESGTPEINTFYPSFIGRTTIPGGGDVNKKYTINVPFTPVLMPTLEGESASNIYMHTFDYAEGTQYMNWLEYTIRAYDSAGNLIKERTICISTRESPGMTSYAGLVPKIDYVGEFDGAGAWQGDTVNLNIEGYGIYYIDIRRSEKATYWGNNPIHDANAYLCWTDTSSYSPVFGCSYVQNLQQATSEAIVSGGVRSNATITKRMLLSTGKTPADYLISYCKMFGLVILCNRDEKRVSIYQRKTFYTGGVVNLEGKVAAGDETTPFSFDAKWYDFSTPYKEGEFAKYYANTEKKTYGMQRVNTGYDFNSEAKDLLSGLAFNGACEVLEKSNLFCWVNDGGYTVPSFFLGGGTFSLLNASDETEDFQLPVPGVDAFISWWGKDRGYDYFPKLQFHNEENAPYNERDTLVFFNGIYSLIAGEESFKATDDNVPMINLNNGRPCWIISSASDMIVDLPMFTRHIWNDTLDTIQKTLDFGIPAIVDNPGVSFDNNSDIYDQYWAKYISDRYDDDTRVMVCKVDLSQFQVNETMFRPFYFFDGAYWVLNRIINHSITTFDDTECEFIKVQDTNHYRQ